MAVTVGHICTPSGLPQRSLPVFLFNKCFGFLQLKQFLRLEKKIFFIKSKAALSKRNPKNHLPKSQSILIYYDILIYHLKKERRMEKFLKIFDALSDETRLRIFLLLTRNELCVCELTNILNMKQPRISNCLRILKEAGLVESEREGQWIIYSVNPITVENEVIQSLKKEVKLPASDRRRIVKCKGESIREKCRVG